MTSHINSLGLSPNILLRAYACGIFPMAESADDPALFWVEPEQRGILPLDAFHVPRSLARVLRREVFEFRVDSDFEAVIDGCAEAVENRPTTWINSTIRELYGDLFDMGRCHTVEAWHDGKLVGGLYGVHIGGAFFGESMFSRMTDASKAALVHLAARLRKGGFKLLDTQFTTEHLNRFGAKEIPREIYSRLLDEAIQAEGNFHCWPAAGVSGRESLQAVSHTS